MSLTVLIAAPEHFAALKQHTDLTGAEAFADTDALKALEVISRRRPQVVVLEQLFAASARGTAFINRIKADPGLASCEIRIIEADGGVARGPAEPAGAALVDVAAVVIDAPPEVFDRAGTRRAPRFDMTRTIEVLIDGNPATLIDISLVGAQVMSPSSLRPNQRVRISLLDTERPIKFNGIVAWATFEMPQEGPRYRAGVDFADEAQDAVARFIDSITKA